MEIIFPQRSLAFNQLCYWYADEYANEIKNKFLKLSNGQIIEDFKCNGCFDGDFWMIEIYRKNSSIIKDYITAIDSTFVFYILRKSKLKKENKYYIVLERKLVIFVFSLRV